jgi:hypothetical protein
MTASNAKSAVKAPVIAVKAPARAKFPATAKVTVLKDPGKRGASALRFALYGGVGATTTVGDYVKAAGKYGYPDLAWDLAREFIKIEA